MLKETVKWQRRTVTHRPVRFRFSASSWSVEADSLVLNLWAASLSCVDQVIVLLTREISSIPSSFRSYAARQLCWSFFLVTGSESKVSAGGPGDSGQHECPVKICHLRKYATKSTHMMSDRLKYRSFLEIHLVHLWLG